MTIDMSSQQMLSDERAHFPYANLNSFWMYLTLVIHGL